MPGGRVVGEVVDTGRDRLHVGGYLQDTLQTCRAVRHIRYTSIR